MRLSLLLALLAAPAFANQGEKLDATLQALKASQAKAKEISEQVGQVEAELGQLEADSETLVQNIRTQQDNIAANRAQIRALEAKQQAKQQQLNARRSEVAKLLHGMIRLQRMPRHYIAAQPGDMHSLLRTASALNISYDASHSQINLLYAEYAQLNALQSQLQASQQKLAGALETVQQQQTALTRTLAQRRQLQRSLRRDQAKVNARVHQLSSDSENLQELIAKLEAETLLFKNLGLPATKPNAPTRRASSQSISTRKGRLAYPARGELVARFGDKRQDDDKIEGIEILTPIAAPVTAPHGGKIVFSGAFMDYGPMVIIEHDKQYHSVIAGLDLVEVQPGDQIGTGGILGVMGRNTRQRTLYYELRKNSKPIDPSVWIGNLNKLALKR